MRVWKSPVRPKQAPRCASYFRAVTAAILDVNQAGSVNVALPQMKSVGEAMAIRRTFKESLQKCFLSL